MFDMTDADEWADNDVKREQDYCTQMTPVLRRTHARSLANTLTNTRTHARTHAHTHTQTHTHTHTHTQCSQRRGWLAGGEGCVKKSAMCRRGMMMQRAWMMRPLKAHSVTLFRSRTSSSACSLYVVICVCVCESRKLHVVLCLFYST
jgi:Tfp pilus assembly protein FimT